MNDFKIDKGIPLPTSLREETIGFSVLDNMKVGDSVLFPPRDEKRARNQAYRRHPKHYTFRKVTDGYRCWRTK